MPVEAQDPYSFLLLQKIECADYSAGAVNVVKRDSDAAERAPGECFLTGEYTRVTKREVVHFAANDILQGAAPEIVSGDPQQSLISILTDEFGFLATNGIRVRYSSPVPDQCDLETVLFIYEFAVSLRHCEGASTNENTHHSQNAFDFDIALAQ
ncbi:MAG TPA: hypothetical protein VFF31_29820 [Blastocatellia bacterium]|nr:hypothetical protein [Blastocatellia bacterium]